MNERSVIPVEKVNGPVLLLSTKADTVWPSEESGKRLEQRLTQAGFPYAHRHICFDFMSHIMLENANGFVRVLCRSEREHPQECTEERRRMAQEGFDWLERIW